MIYVDYCLMRNRGSELELSSKIKKYLSVDTWYHATTLDNWNSITKKGVLIDYNKRSSHDLDFGYGFYLTNAQDKAENYISRQRFEVLENKEPIILGFEFDALSCFQNKSYSSKILFR